MLVAHYSNINVLEVPNLNLHVYRELVEQAFNIYCAQSNPKNLEFLTTYEKEIRDTITEKDIKRVKRLSDQKIIR